VLVTGAASADEKSEAIIIEATATILAFYRRLFCAYTKDEEESAATSEPSEVRPRQEIGLTGLPLRNSRSK
jgi:hypothetical protein